MNQKVVLITGASSGMGKATAKRLISEGHIVYGAARRIENMQDLIAFGGHSIKMDITKEEDISSTVGQIISEQGRIDVLVNNAGYAAYGSVEDVSMADGRAQMEVNLMGLIAITQRVLPHMRKQRSGNIINISSIGGKVCFPLGAWYHASKFAVEGFSDCLRLEVKDFGINVSVIEPGVIVTEFEDVMTQPMLDRSKGGPYEKYANLVADAQRRVQKTGSKTSPDIIAKLVSKAMNSANPKTRYSGGDYAKLLLFLRKWLSDKTFDKVAMNQIS
jgi:NADP-dependent 3-hydroxy acid dehydrogenase YdfG